MEHLEHSQRERDNPLTTSQEEFPFRVAVCAWCKPKELGAGIGSLSHGICPRHLRKMRQQLERVSSGNSKDTLLLRVRCSRELKQSLEEIAHLQNTEASAVVRLACEEYIARTRAAKPVLPLFT